MSDKDPRLAENYHSEDNANNEQDQNDNELSDTDYLTPITDEDWAPLLDECGDTLRHGARDGESYQEQVVARSYTLNSARRYLGLQKQTIERAVKAGHLPQFIDPEHRPRIPAYAIETLVNEPTYYEKIASYERLKARDIALVLGASNSAIRRKLDKIHADRNSPAWGDIRGLIDDLPGTLEAFREAVDEQRIAKKQERKQAKNAERERRRRMVEEERRRREMLRQQLMDAFPDWQEEDRTHQNMLIHIGPPNSGKTHDALTRLTEAGSGWYLAPLRLLAFEIHDRLNQRGVPCNLLTGEERIEVPDAKITAATIEMFDASRSGNCVIIDEAQMIADPDRGWAWTRALTEALAPEIHVIAPPTAQGLLLHIAQAADIPAGITQHQRLSPIKVADQPWPLRNLPKRTILVAFSRRSVLGLKTKLEAMKYSVSVVYGSLPPEVRRKQADRFANGETDICVATDAVGMGLNLPADYVCFAEVEKFDGRDIRLLRPDEVQQIGGRAGRYGMSQAGEVGATNKRDLQLISSLFHREASKLTHARVAPAVEELELIPGNLANKLTEWSSLQSIPEVLRSSVRTADMNERIELANMLEDWMVEEVGLAAAVKLVNAPTRKSSRGYWYDCVMAILEELPMPLPPNAPAHIRAEADLDETEQCIACADIYMWLANRAEFTHFGPNIEDVKEERLEWSMRIDEALLRKVAMQQEARRRKGRRY
jgi:hypothetical protein